jgi:queuine tRNA-ribosyltransferase
VSFTIRTRDPGSRARTGTLRLAHGDVRTPAFVPLATKAVVKTLEVREAAELGFDMVLGNTFHLFLTPGHELIGKLGGLHRFMAWDRPIITDSGGFQVFSMGHGAVADEIKGRAAQTAGERAGATLKITEDGVTFRSYLDGSETFMGPETSMEVQAALGSDIALVFDECTPFHGGRDYTARSTERTHRWLDRCLAWHDAHGPDGQVVYGIVQGGVEEDLRRASAQEVAARPVGGIAIGGTLGEDKDQMFEVVGWAVEELDEERPRHLLGIGEIDDLVRGVELGMDTFDCAMPTRIGRHGMAVVPDPGHRWRVDLAKARFRDADEPLLDGCPCPACAHGYTRAYVHYLLKAREQTAQRLLTIHNLAYVQRLMAELRAAIDEARLPAAAAAVRDGAAPWELAA